MVTVFTSDALDAHERARRDEPQSDLEIWRFRNVSNSLAWKGRMFISPGLRSATKASLDRFDIVHLHEYRSFQNLVVAPLARARLVPVVIQAHGSLSASEGHGFWKKLYDAFLGQKVLDCTARAIALSLDEAELYTQIGVPSNKVEVVPNALSPPPSIPRDSGRLFRNSYAIDREAGVVTYLGRLHQSKGIDLLLEAAAAMAKTSRRFALLLAGPDDGAGSHLKKRAERLGIASLVRFTGFLEEEARLSALQASDVVVIPAFTGFPITILEAYLLERPVVTTERSDRLDWLTDAVARTTRFEAGHLANAIQELLLNPQLRSELGAAGKRQVLERFTWDTIGKRYEKLYQECIDEARIAREPPIQCSQSCP